ncbi:helix-turn-helix domain-containing protein [Candidatus Protochlamydia phocaeensis]|uniref:helix-turn-helix domain-containing protein n=1 Tax=Candidatus Protochlamydia phocaeensis TaxID=1414722 RepID=UPI000838F0CB|nr:helix-turn-helix domain-containing protein [Candidatus Protochlamydia phocaeensis]
MSDILNIDEAAQFLRVSKTTLYRYVQSGKIPAFKMGKNWKFHRELLNDWMKNQIQDNSIEFGLDKTKVVSEALEVSARD